MGFIKGCFQTIPLEGTKLKYVTMQLNTFANFIRELLKRLLKRLSYIICELYFGVICCLIDSTLHGKKLELLHKVPHILQTSQSIFQKTLSDTKAIYWRSAGKLEIYTG